MLAPLEAMEALTETDSADLSHLRNWVFVDQTFKLYALNLAVSEALYTSLHMLEITLRNAGHRRLTDAYGELWFSHPDVIADRYQRQKVLDVAAKIGVEVANGKVVAELTFGFRTASFGRANTPLWVGSSSGEYSHQKCRCSASRSRGD